MELLLTVELKGTNATPVQISIIYNRFGTVDSIDWREAIPDVLDIIDLDDYDSDDDEDWQPPRHVDFEEDDDEEILEYQSTDDDSDYSD